LAIYGYLQGGHKVGTKFNCSSLERLKYDKQNYIYSFFQISKIIILYIQKKNVWYMKMNFRYPK